MLDHPSLEATPEAETETNTPAERPQARYVCGRYRLRVEALTAAGEAVGVVTETLAEPSSEEWARVYPPLRAALPPRPPSPAGKGEQEGTRFAFVGGLPGEVVEIEVRWSLPRPGRKRAKRVPPPQVRLVGVIEAGERRVQPECPVFGECGGCQFQHMPYTDQLAWKAERVRSLLAAAGFAEPPVLAALGSEIPWGYRNHMRFSVNREGQAGLTARGSHRVLPLRACPIAHARINDVLDAIQPYQVERPQLLVRYGVDTGQTLLQPALGAELRAALAAAGFALHDDAIEERMGGHTFRIRPSSFFQTNTGQANRMAELVVAALPADPNVTLVDAYCGVGTFARILADRAGRVLAIEESASAIHDAQYNLRDVTNVEIIQGKVEDVLPDITERLDGLVIDPPRAGCQRPVLDALAARRPARVVYVSCNPETLARDLRYLCIERGAYRLASAQPLDMFPQTAHIETVTVLEAVPGVPGGQP